MTSSGLSLRSDWTWSSSSWANRTGVSSASETTRCLADLFALADQRLYKAKSTGRDRVVGEPDSQEADTAVAWTKSARI